MAQRVVKTTYLLGLLFLVSALVYFFASNWPELGRLTKVGIGAGFMILFYGLSATVFRHHFFSKWLLIFGAITFGICVALIGQVYNSHADSFLLFFIWFIPTAILAWLTRGRFLSIFSFGLLQLTFWFYYFPSSYQIERGEWPSFFILLLFAVINGMVALLGRSSILSVLSYFAMHSWLFVVFVQGISMDQFHFWPYVHAFMFVLFLIYVKKQPYFICTVLFTGMFWVVQYFRFVERHFGGNWYIFGLVLAVIIVYIGIYVLRWMKKRSNGKVEKVFLVAFQTIVTGVASVIAIGSIMQLLSFWFDVFSPYWLFSISVFLFVVPGLLWKRWNDVVRYTLLAIGYMLGAFSVTEISFIVISVYIAGLFIVSWRMPAAVRTMTNIAVSLYFAMMMLDEWSDIRYTLFAVFVFYGIIYWVTKHTYERLVFLASSFATLLLLTSADLVEMDWTYVVWNILFLCFVAFVLFFRTNEKEQSIAWLYTFLFLILKYYEWVWNLLHKSMTLAIVGICLLIVASIVQKRKAISFSVTKQKWLPLFVVMILQGAFIIYVTFDKEQHLQYGQQIKLQLEPIDPRSLIQGDYIRLQYEISTIEGMNELGKVQVILRKDEAGIHRLVGIYSLNGKKRNGDMYQEGDVLVNGNIYGDTIIYGIETYFVPEKTGGDIQQRARFAYVRVSKTGDALLEKVSEQ
ncbi:GDYXXLXY domain-containing protein [Anoxybacillus kestanbolensis]|uniref:GDYXXLXY domain-containing protein n=3 Tax=Anoxybacillaceae TaxID=3120669 RepID=UPI001EDB0B93|nr:MULTISPECIES: GDYXXLXY domain-containing protein [Anoxybacillus]MCG5025054.1 GDYXXLXY domain-containing protein [Anoxybacillus flavithermus]MCG6195982.1 GDYXXLXY domain-containing protein [Anoxybacillus sp. LAT_38]MCG3083609.1 GDYXXLXY domain-containing protein [Anoxybacillus sp. LAT27]MCG6170288.1 GDYXXLXY domain-containing protein [Anoxybacillus sp. LAT_11]MCG6174819.1 GDYXXLXY domain-containing protein [Anoxybacillus sp. LAT_31]